MRYAAKLAPVEAEVRRRLGNFILAENDDTLEGVILAALMRAAGDAGGGGDVHRRSDRRAPGAAAGRGARVPPRHR